MSSSHWHDCLELNYVRRGQGRYRIGDLVFQLTPGSVFVIPPGMPHQTFADPEDPHWNLTIYLRPESVARLGSQTERMVQDLMYSVQHRRAADAPSEWDRLTAQLYDEAVRRPGNPDRDMIAAHLLQACLLVRRAARMTTSPALAPQQDRAGARHVHCVFAHVETHLGEHLTVAGVAKRLGLDPGYVGSLFHEHTGVRLLDYITLRRLEIARQLISGTGLSLREVARRSGFLDEATFYRRFRQHFGTSPRCLRS